MINGNNNNNHSDSKRSQTLFQSYLDCLKLIKNNIQNDIDDQYMINGMFIDCE